MTSREDSIQLSSYCLICGIQFNDLWRLRRHQDSAKHKQQEIINIMNQLCANNNNNDKYVYASSCYISSDKDAQGNNLFLI